VSSQERVGGSSAVVGSLPTHGAKCQRAPTASVPQWSVDSGRQTLTEVFICATSLVARTIGSSFGFIQGRGEDAMVAMVAMVVMREPAMAPFQNLYDLTSLLTCASTVLHFLFSGPP
jgi:hypothetical protein